MKKNIQFALSCCFRIAHLFFYRADEEMGIEIRKKFDFSFSPYPYSIHSSRQVYIRHITVSAHKHIA